jgi:hypothetical protein
MIFMIIIRMSIMMWMDVDVEGADEAEREFFFKHRETLKEDKRLLKRWEAFIFRKTEEHPNLLSGILMAAADLVGSIEASRRSRARAGEEVAQRREVRHWTGETERGSRVAVARHGAQCSKNVVSQRT